FRRAHRGTGRRARGVARVVVVARDRLGRDQGLGARVLRQREPGVAPGALELRLGLRELRLVGARVDREQYVALADLLALAERDAVDVAAHARAELDG